MKAIRIKKDRGTRNRFAVRAAAVFLIIAMAAGMSLSFAATAPTVTKSARIFPNGSIDNGTERSPVDVDIDDFIEYIIKINNPHISGQTPAYDVLFVLDWSYSMNSGYEDSQLPNKQFPISQTARMRAKSTVETLSQQVFSRYPQSRIALMGCNSNTRNSGDPSHTYFQVDTEFVDSSQYSTVIKNAFSKDPELRLDDNAMFLKAAVDKMEGIASSYGGGKNPYRPSIKEAPRSTIKPREKSASRIPVIVMISDFQLGMGDFGDGVTGSGGNWSDLHSQAERFKTAYPEGILLAARADTAESRLTHNDRFCGDEHNSKMDETFVELGGTENGQNRWGWVKFLPNQTQSYQDSLLFSIIKEKVAVPSPVATIKDLLPEGLEYVSSSPQGRRNTVGARDQITWDYSSLPGGETEVRVVAKVKNYGTFVNKGEAVIEGYGVIPSNPTYHRARPLTASKIAQVMPKGAPDTGTEENPVPVKVGNIIMYTVRADNPTSSDLTDVRVTDLLPLGTKFVGGELPGTVTSEDGRDRVTWTGQTIPPGGKDFRFYAEVQMARKLINSAEVSIDSSRKATTNKTYHDAGDTDETLKLHIRQIVLDRNNSKIELPEKAFMRLTNDGITTGITAESGVHGGRDIAFADYVITTTASDRTCAVADIIPQYYEYAGYIATSEKVAHDPTERLHGGISLDYGAKSEYWVTVYIRPKATPLGDHTWDFRTNYFGEIFNA
ncbi:MAG: DUF11 domain-containing protein [Clostridiales Family XIII bacterium]|jgi:uncharacterized repeat protein (TIGR01451 family)|nr:DUF11 domain-containing protein [Clostridiales Family XIII bacterium]